MRSIYGTKSPYSVVPSPFAQYKMNDDAASTTVVDSTGYHNGTAQQDTNMLQIADSTDANEGAIQLKISNPLVTFIFDDGYLTDLTVMKDVFDAQGEVACSAIVSDLVGGDGRLTEPNLVTLQTAGWEILSHTKTHADLTGLSEANIRTEMTASKTSLEGMGLTINNLVYPGGTWNTTVTGIAQEYYNSGRVVQNQINPRNLNPFTLMCLPADDHTELATFKTYVDTAESDSKWMIFLLHETDGDDATAISELIDYIQAKSISIVTVQQALTSATFSTGGKINGAFDFRGILSLGGTYEYIEIDDHDDFTPALTPFSISAWVYIHDCDAFEGFGISKGTWGDEAEWWLRILTDTGNILEFILIDNSESAYIGRRINVDFSNYANQWLHIVATYDGGILCSGFKIYLNATQADTDDHSTGSFTAVENLTKPVYIGRYTVNYFDGLIDNVMFFKNVLTERQVQRLFDFRVKESLFCPNPNRIYSKNMLKNAIFGGVIG